jgi:GntR family transcriptional regulator
VIVLRFDRSSAVPPYLQLVAQVHEALRLGRLAVGDQLPAAREVVAASGLNLNTVLKAYRELAHQGLVETRQGAGTVVVGDLGGADPALLTKHRTRFERWVREAQADGLEPPDVRAVVTSVLGEDAPGDVRDAGRTA